MTYEERETKYYESEELKHGLRNNTDKVSLFRLKRQAETHYKMQNISILK